MRLTFLSSSMIKLTQAAVTEIKRLQSKQQPNILFRLAVKPGGCSGWVYDMSFEQALRVGDRIFECNKVQVVIDDETLPYINDLTLDYSEDLMGGGFRFDNNRAKTTCGCGNSFSIDDGD
jgi:iron-sulfur cluster assembly protein